jgi:hypothetical protein
LLSIAIILLARQTWRPEFMARFKCVLCLPPSRPLS